MQKKHFISNSNDFEKLRHDSNSNNFFSIIDTTKIKTDYESLGLGDSKNIFSFIAWGIKKTWK